MVISGWYVGLIKIFLMKTIKINKSNNIFAEKNKKKNKQSLVWGKMELNWWFVILISILEVRYHFFYILLWTKILPCNIHLKTLLNHLPVLQFS